MRGRIAVLAALCAGALVAESREPAPEPRAVPGFEVDEPPPHLARLIARARGTGFEADVAARELGALPEAEPYLRHALLRAPHRRLRFAHEAQLDARDARNVRRAKAWADAGRADLLVEAAVLARTDADGDALAEQLVVLAIETSARATKARAAAVGPPKKGDEPVRGAFNLAFSAFDRKGGYARKSGDVVRLHQTAMTTAVRAREVFAPALFAQSVTVVRDRLTLEGNNHYLSDAILFANCDVTLGSLDRGFAIVDGDVTCWGKAPDGGWLDVWHGTVVVRGQVRGQPWFDGHHLALFTGGDLNARVDGLRSGVVFAGGTARVTGKGEAAVKSNVKENPFGVRFFETAELGVRAEDAESGARLARVDANSVLAAHGLKVGDVVVRIDETRVPNAKEFRRELRRAAVSGSGVFWVRGDGARQTRVVHFGNALGR